MDDDHLDLYDLKAFETLPGIDLGLWLRLVLGLLLLAVAAVLLL